MLQTIIRGLTCIGSSGLGIQTTYDIYCITHIILIHMQTRLQTVVMLVRKKVKMLVHNLGSHTQLKGLGLATLQLKQQAITQIRGGNARRVQRPHHIKGTLHVRLRDFHALGYRDIRSYGA